MAVLYSLFRRAISLHMAQIPAGRLAKKTRRNAGFFYAHIHQPRQEIAPHSQNLTL